MTCKPEFKYLQDALDLGWEAGGKTRKKLMKKVEKNEKRAREGPAYLSPKHT